MHDLNTIVTINKATLAAYGTSALINHMELLIREKCDYTQVQQILYQRAVTNDLTAFQFLVGYAPIRNGG